jgi:hypothetical protein
VRLRRTPAETEPADAVEETTAERAERPVKGRPTPKRRDVAPKRQPISAPRTNKEASEWRKQQNKAAPGAAKLSNAELREARLRGDARALPRRDQGPVRQLARDWVDTHRMAANFLLVVLLVYIAALLVPSLSVYLSPAALGILIILLGECMYAATRVKREAAARFGTVSKETTLGLGLYIAGRAYLPRRMRVPKPRYAIGEEIPR